METKIPSKEKKETQSATVQLVPDAIEPLVKNLRPLKLPVDAKKTTQRLFLISDHKPGVKNIQYFPRCITHQIGQYTSLPDLNSYLQTDIENFRALESLLIERAKRLSLQWYGLLLKANHFDKYKSVYLTDFLKELSHDNKQRIGFLQYAINQECFELIAYLVQKKKDINSPWVERYETSKYLAGEARLHRSFSPEKNSHLHTVLDKEFAVPSINAERILYAMKVGVEVSAHQFASLLIPCACQILNNAEQYSDARIVAAGELLLMAFKRKLLNKIADLTKIMQVARYISSPDIKRIEAFFLINKLKSILPNEWNFFADQRDTQLIQSAILQLEKIVALTQINYQNIRFLEKIKNTLLEKSEPLGELSQLLRSLEKSGLIIFQPAAGQTDFDVKAKSLIRQEPTDGVDRLDGLFSSLITRIGKFKKPLPAHPNRLYSRIQTNIVLDKSTALICLASSSKPDLSSQLLIETLTMAGAPHCRLYTLADRPDGLLHHAARIISDTEKMPDLSGYTIHVKVITLASSIELQDHLEAQQDQPVSIEWLKGEGTVDWLIWHDAMLAKIMGNNSLNCQ